MKFSLENTLNSRKTGTDYHGIQKIPYIVQRFVIKLTNWIIPFKLSRLLVTHDPHMTEESCPGVGKLFLPKGLRGRYIASALLLG